MARIYDNLETKFTDGLQGIISNVGVKRVDFCVGYFNLRGKKGMTGHIKAENCTHIALIERKFMGMDTASILFFNQAGSAMFKIFLGRDEHRQLLAEQVSAFHALSSSLKEHA